MQLGGKQLCNPIFETGAIFAGIRKVVGVRTNAQLALSGTGAEEHEHQGARKRAVKAV
jgi:hypothetical protein